jgi:hypothetical protein
MLVVPALGAQYGSLRGSDWAICTKRKLPLMICRNSQERWLRIESFAQA